MVLCQVNGEDLYEHVEYPHYLAVARAVFSAIVDSGDKRGVPCDARTREVFDATARLRTSAWWCVVRHPLLSMRVFLFVVTYVESSVGLVVQWSSIAGRLSSGPLYQNPSLEQLSRCTSVRVPFSAPVTRLLSRYTSLAVIC